MINLTINGIPMSVEEGTTILEAARTADIRIPTLCYLKDRNQIASCRMCVVEVAGRSNLVASCNTPVEEGMEVTTDNDRISGQERRLWI